MFMLSSCSNTVDSVKKGLTGAKNNSADEFLIKKKDPLILPPDFENDWPTRAVVSCKAQNAPTFTIGGVYTAEDEPYKVRSGLKKLSIFSKFREARSRLYRRRF